MVLNPAPIVLFAFRRPEHLAACLKALRGNEQAAQSDLHVFCDGARGPQDEPGVAAVRALVGQITGFGSVTVHDSEVNRGLARSVIDGIDEVLSHHDRVIVIEDDIVVSPDFLRFMNDALDLYRDDEQVVSIHGFTVPTATAMPQTFFLRGADCWGWATWRRGWQVFNPDGAALLDKLRASGLERKFDLNGAYPYTAMLARQVRGEVDSWAIRWHASAFLSNRLTLYPGRSLVENIGQDGSGTHSESSPSHETTALEMTFPLARIELTESAVAREAIARALSKHHSSWWSRGVRCIREKLGV